MQAADHRIAAEPRQMGGPRHSFKDAERRDRPEVRGRVRPARGRAAERYAARHVQRAGRKVSPALRAEQEAARAGAALRDKRGYKNGVYYPAAKRLMTAGRPHGGEASSGTGAQVRAKRERDRERGLMPDEERPTYKTQTAAPGDNPSIKAAVPASASLKARTSRTSSKRSRAEINAQAAARHVDLTIREPILRMKIPKTVQRQRPRSHGLPTAAPQAEAGLRLPRPHHGG